jgi:ADP-heptose:LPS heptosyltransferase
MQLRTKQLLDLYVGGFLVACLVLPVRIAGLILRRNHDLSKPRHIVFIKMLGGGSLFLALPAVLAIRKAHPGCQISLLCSRHIEGFGKAFGAFDNVRVVDDRNLLTLAWSSLTQLAWMIMHADTTIDLEVHSRLTTIYSTLSLARNRFGFADHNSMWRRRLYTHVIFFNFTTGLYSFYDAIAALFGAREISSAPATELMHRQVASQSSELRGTYLAIGVGCSNLGKERELDPQAWRDLLSQVQRAKPDLQFVFLGGADDHTTAQAVAQSFPGSINLCGKLSILGSCRVLQGAVAYAGIDSFLMHMARSLCPRVLGFWGPTSPETLLRPLPVIEHQESLRYLCSPCIHRVVHPPCQGQNECMRHHDLSSAAKFLITALEQSPTPREGYSGHAWAFYPDTRKPSLIDFKVSTR